MSASPGKIQVVGITQVPSSTPSEDQNGIPEGYEKVFVLRFLQARNPDWCKETFFARFDEKATWFDQLSPAFGQDRWFFQDEYDQIRASSSELGSSGQRFPLPESLKYRAQHSIMLNQHAPPSYQL